jgi:murein DD-endopeptidase MepM/ murein hydrolase activator NlpD
MALACASPPPAPPAPAAVFAEACERAEGAMRHGHLDHAESFLSRALALAEASGRTSPEQVRVQLGLARLRRLQGDSGRARHHLGLARFALRGVRRGDSLGLAEIESERARQHQAARLYDEAVVAAREALRIRSDALGADAALVRETTFELAFAHHLAFDYPDAVDAYERALASGARDPEASTEARVIALNRLAWIFERAALPERATASRDRAHTLVAAETPGGGASERLLALGLDGLDERARDGDARRQSMREVGEYSRTWIDERRYHREHFDLERRLLVALRRLDRGMPEQKVRTALTRELQAEFLAFAPARPRDDGDYRYGLPFRSRHPLEVLRTSDGAHTSERVFLHAVDFAAPPGTSVVAARDGLVVRVVQGFSHRHPETEEDEDRQHGHRVNRVIVLHDDHTYATYLPLAGDIEVVEGERVARGQRLGITARLEAGHTPVLHFDVRRNSRTAGSAGVLSPEPVRARFADVKDRDGIPLAGHSFGGGAAAAAPASVAP